jgi:hypothetical protein
MEGRSSLAFFIEENVDIEFAVAGITSIAASSAGFTAVVTSKEAVVAAFRGTATRPIAVVVLETSSHFTHR